MSQVLRTLHLALEPHTRCVHGEFVHLQGHHHGGHDEAESPPSLGDHSELRGSQAHNARHQHCDATAVPQAPLPTVLAEIPPQLLTWLIPAPRLGPAEGRPAIALLHLAPKLSPPQA